MPDVHILTLPGPLPLHLLDHLLPAVERARSDGGASSIRIRSEVADLSVLAESPTCYGPDSGGREA